MLRSQDTTDNAKISSDMIFSCFIKQIYSIHGFKLKNSYRLSADLHFFSKQPDFHPSGPFGQLHGLQRLFPKFSAHRSQGTMGRTGHRIFVHPQGRSKASAQKSTGRFHFQPLWSGVPDLCFQSFKIGPGRPDVVLTRGDCQKPPVVALVIFLRLKANQFFEPARYGNGIQLVTRKIIKIPSPSFRAVSVVSLVLKRISSFGSFKPSW